MSQMPNQNPEQKARDRIDAQLRAAGWAVQDKDAFDPNEGEGQAVRECTTDCGPADYVLFVDRKPVGITEAKKETLGQNITTVEDQTKEYANARLKWVQHTGLPLPFLYEATGVIVRFTDQRDPKPRSREVFSFHRPETLRELLSQEKSLRARLLDLPALIPLDLRDCQIDAVTELDDSVKKAKPRSLVQMATGAGKTFTSITFIHRLLKHARIKRVLFLVDTRNLGEQAEQEFLAYQPSDDNRKFTELYTVQRLNSSHVPKDAEVCVSTIQRMYFILQGNDLDESAEDENPGERRSTRKEPFPVTYNDKVPSSQGVVMKKRWVTKKLGDVGKTQYGLSESMNEDGKGFKIFRMGEVQNGRLIDTGRMKYANIGRSEFEKYRLYDGDVPSSPSAAMGGWRRQLANAFASSTTAAKHQ